MNLSLNSAKGMLMTSVMFQSRDHVKMFVDYMNVKHPNIRFTFEIEDQNSFSFLDIKIIKNTKKKAFETSVSGLDLTLQK